MSSDRILAEGKVHIAAGAPSDSEVRREIEAAKRHGAKLPAGESVQAFEAASAQPEGAGAGAETPLTPWNPRLKPIAGWIVPVLAWASEHGWKGTVTSGYRSFYEQAQLNAAGAFSAPAGYSNHETTAYPGGAVDVTDPSQLIAGAARLHGTAQAGRRRARRGGSGALLRDGRLTRAIHGPRRGEGARLAAPIWFATCMPDPAAAPAAPRLPEEPAARPIRSARPRFACSAR